MKKTKLIIALTFLAGFILASCKKEKLESNYKPEQSITKPGDFDIEFKIFLSEIPQDGGKIVFVHRNKFDTIQIESLAFSDTILFEENLIKVTSINHTYNISDFDVHKFIYIGVFTNNMIEFIANFNYIENGGYAYGNELKEPSYAIAEGGVLSLGEGSNTFNSVWIETEKISDGIIHDFPK